MNIEIDFQRAKDLLDKAMTHKGPDYVYVPSATGCVYFTNDIAIAEQGQVQSHRVPSCLVGHMIDDLGLTNEFDPSMEDHAAPHVLNDLGLRLSRKAAELLERAQAEQDQGTPWGEALHNAERETLGDEALSDDPVRDKWRP